MSGLEVIIEHVSAFAEFVLNGKKGCLLGSDNSDRFREGLGAMNQACKTVHFCLSGFVDFSKDLSILPAPF